MGRRALTAFVAFAMIFLGLPPSVAAALDGGSGSVSLTALGTPYSQDFNTLGNSPDNTIFATLPTGWFISESGTSARNDGKYAAGSGTSTTGDTYSFGATGSTERALGTLLSGTITSTIGASFTNNTGATITQLAIAFTGEMWRAGVTNRNAADRLDFSYSTSASSLTTGTWTAFSGLSVSSPVVNATAGALNGNVSPNRAAVTGTIAGLSVANGATVWIRWVDFDIASSDDGLAIDDFSITPSGTASSTLSMTKSGTGTGTVTSVPAGITCGATCSAPFADGSVVGLTATADPTMTFIGFSANCTSTGPTTCNVTVSGATSVTATFTAPPQQFTLTLNKAGLGAGSVTSAPSGISCDASCASAAASFDQGTAITLTAAPSAGSGYPTWTNCAPATLTTCTLTLSANTTVTATFPVLTAIHAIQGSTRFSPLAGQRLTTTGLVTARKSNGFFIQTPDADSDPNTSEGIFVFTSSTPPSAATVGNLIQVTANVQDFVPTSDPYSPAVTELSGSPATLVLSTGNSLPTPITLTSANYDPNGGIDQLVKYEGMRVRIDDTLTTTSPSGESQDEASATSTTFGSFYAVFPGVARPFREPGIERPEPNPPAFSTGPNIPTYDANPERVRIDAGGLTGTDKLDVTTGAAVSGIVGVLDFTFRSYSIYLTQSATLVHDGITAALPVRVPQSYEFTVSSANMERFFDTVQDPQKEPVLTSTAFANRLNKASLEIRDVLHMPDVIGVEEVEHQSTLQALADKINADEVALGHPNPMYVAYLEEGNDVGGIDSGFLVKTSRVHVTSVTQYNKNETYIDPNTGLPFIENGKTALLNDRPPLVLVGEIHSVVGPDYPVIVIVNHLRSLSGLTGTDAWRISNKRRAQAESLARLIQGYQSADPSAHVISIGDYNAYQFNDGYVDSLGTIKGTPTPADQVELASPDLVDPDLIDLVDSAPAGQRYSFSFDGNAQELDHVLITQNLTPRVVELQYARNNADFGATYRNNPNRPERISDHDPIVAYFAFPPQITAPADLTAEASATGCVAPVNPGTPTTFGRSIVVTRDPSSSTFALGTTTVTWTATDAGGTSATATQHVTVVDTHAPAITAPAPVISGTGPGSTTPTAFISDADLGSAAASDVCDFSITRSGVPSGNLFPLGTTTISYVATDSSGNTASATQTVTLTDDTPPDLTAPADVVTFTGSASTSCVVVVNDATLGIATASDNSGRPVTIARVGVPTGNAFPVGVTTIRYTATDSSGNVATGQQLVTVVDDTPPSLVKNDPWLEHYPTLLDVPSLDLSGATAVDNCGSVTVVLAVTNNGGAGTPASPLILTATFTATDTAGNTATVSETTTVTDDIAPTITGSATPAANAKGWRNTPVTVHFTCNDNVLVASCTPDVTLSADGANQQATGTAVDWAANSATTTVGGINIDRTAPVITFGGASTYTIDQVVNVTCVAVDALSGIDTATCPTASGPAWSFTLGAHTLNASATDNAGNVATASTSFTITASTTSLCALARTFVTNAGEQTSLCSKLAASADAAARGNVKARDNQIQAFINEVNAQRGKAITEASADLLIALVGRL